MISLNIKLVLETLYAMSSCPVHEAYVRMKEVTSSNLCAFDASCHHEFEKVNVASPGIIPNQSVAWCARDTYGIEVASLSNHSILRTYMTDLGWFQRKQKQSFSDPRRQLTSSACELKKVTSSIQTYPS